MLLALIFGHVNFFFGRAEILEFEKPDHYFQTADWFFKNMVILSEKRLPRQSLKPKASAFSTGVRLLRDTGARPDFDTLTQESRLAWVFHRVLVLLKRILQRVSRTSAQRWASSISQDPFGLSTISVALRSEFSTEGKDSPVTCFCHSTFIRCFWPFSKHGTTTTSIDSVSLLGLVA